MKRLLGIIVVLAVLIGAASSHSKSSVSTTTAASSPPLSSASTSPRASRRHAAHVNYTRCDQNISVGSATTCGFADNVFRAFARQVYEEGSEPADYTVHAASPTTGKTYAMRCRTVSETTRCTGGKGAAVRFPLHAAQVYTRPSSQAGSATSGAEEESEYEEREVESESSSSEPSSECTSGTYVNSAGNVVCSPEQAPSAPAGATAECEDGTYSFSESRSGTCSHHGGVSKWL